MEYTYDSVCPITQEPIIDAVILKEDGRIYERSAIEEWIRYTGLSPITGHEIIHAELVPTVAPTPVCVPMLSRTSVSPTLLIIILDNSMKMYKYSEAAKEAVMAVASVMGEHDAVALISFCGAAKVELPITPKQSLQHGELLGALYGVTPLASSYRPIAGLNMAARIASQPNASAYRIRTLLITHPNPSNTHAEIETRADILYRIGSDDDIKDIVSRRKN